MKLAIWNIRSGEKEVQTPAANEQTASRMRFAQLVAALLVSAKEKSDKARMGSYVIILIHRKASVACVLRGFLPSRLIILGLMTLAVEAP